MNAILCKACGFENDLSRKFCQNCGARLEVPAGMENKPPSPAAPTRHPKPAQPKSRRGLGTLVFCLGREVIWMAVMAAILAAIIQAVRMPDEIPPVLPSHPQLASVLASDIRAARESPRAKSIAITTDAANNFLASRVAGVEPNPGSFRAVLERAYVVTGEGTLTLGVAQRIRWFTVHLRLGMRPSVSPQGVQADFVSGSIGRLPVPRALVPLYAMTFGGLFETLADPVKWFSNASSIHLAPGGATVVWPGSTRW
jgi:hypothetical protein